MPILSMDAPELERLRSKSWEITRLLPDIRLQSAASVGQFSASWYGAQYGLEAAKVYQEASQMTLGAVLENVGLPVASIFLEVAEGLEIDVVGAVTEALVKTYQTVDNAITSMRDAGDALDGGAAMEAAVTGGIGFAVDGFSQVRITGWIVKLAWSVAKFARGIVGMVKAQREYGEIDAVYPPTVFNPTTDNQILNSIIADMRHTKDWSRRFGPPQLGQGQGTQPDYWLRDIEGGGVEVTRKIGWDAAGNQMDWQASGWTGMVPGGTQLVRGVQVRGNGVTIIGPGLLPSAQQVLFWLWSGIIGKKGNAGPAMYCVDPQVLRTWGSYIGGLHQFIYETGGLDGAQKKAVMQRLDRAQGVPLFGWGTSVKPSSNEHDNYHPLKMADALEQRQAAFLDTLLVAYIDEDYVALKKSPALRAQWVKRRKDLLAHPARCDVDLDNVPDADYREALRAAGAGTGQCRQAATSFAAATIGGFSSGGGPDANPFDSSPGGSESRGIGWLPLLALGAGAWYAYKKGYLSKLPFVR